jgi:omega-amidase
MKKRLALIQAHIAMGDPETNYAHILALMEKTMQRDTDIIVLPELWNTGFFPANTAELADREGERTIREIGRFARECQVNVVAGSTAVTEGHSLYNRSYVFDRKGNVVACYDKVHLFSPSGEEKVFTGGDHFVHFYLDDIPCSMGICYDIRFPYFIRQEVLQGTDLFFVPAAWPQIRNAHWKILNRARAIENQVYLCAVNQCGQSGPTLFGGESLLLDPLGESILHLEEEEEIAYGRMDTDVLDKVRKYIPVFKDRRKGFDEEGEFPFEK